MSNDVEQRGKPPLVHMHGRAVLVGCYCLVCAGRRTWLTLGQAALLRPRPRRWRCKACGASGKLGVGE
jgi:hypothetical protein